MTAQIENGVEPKICNGVNVTQLENTITAIKQDPDMANFKFHVKNKWNKGASNTAAVQNFYGAHQDIAHTRKHTIQADEPAILCGEDQGANPVETLLAALSGCMTTTLVYKSAAQGQRIESVESSYQGDIDLKGFLELSDVDPGYKEITVKFKIKGDVSKEDAEQLVKSSPVYDTLRRPIKINIEVEKEK